MPVYDLDFGAAAAAEDVEVALERAEIGLAAVLPSR